MSGPLAGIRVVELATWFTAPSAACILADQGADVVKVEAPAGDVFRMSGTARAKMSAQWIAAVWNGSVEVVEDEVLGSYRAAMAPVRFDGQAFGTRNAPRPAGSGTQSVLRDWGIRRPG